MAQDPATARYPDMPVAAIDFAKADVIVAARRLAACLTAWSELDREPDRKGEARHVASSLAPGFNG